MKKILTVILLGVFSICMSSANAAQDLKNVDEDQQKESDYNVKVPPPVQSGRRADQSAGQVQVFKQANPSDTFLEESLASEYERDGKKEDAKKTWKALMAKDTNNAELYGRYADALNRMGDASGAIAQLEKAQQLDSNNNMFYNLRMAEILAANNQQDEAKAILTKLMNETKDSYIKEDAKRRLDKIDAKKNMPPAPKSGAPVSSVTQPVQQTTVPDSVGLQQPK
nr:tetratricopeptide repeat protein [Candidatus Omnitrophota bacterium]